MPPCHWMDGDGTPFNSSTRKAEAEEAELKALATQAPPPLPHEVSALVLMIVAFCFVAFVCL